MEITMSIQVCIISWMNYAYKENDEKKSFFWKSKASISCIPMWEHDRGAHNKKNRDYYEYQVYLIARTNINIIRKIVERKPFLAIPKHQYPMS